MKLTHSITLHHHSDMAEHFGVHCVAAVYGYKELISRGGLSITLINNGSRDFTVERGSVLARLTFEMEYKVEGFDELVPFS